MHGVHVMPFIALAMLLTDMLDGSSLYFRCEAVLAGEYEAALPLFEAACDAVRVRMWEYGW